MLKKILVTAVFILLTFCLTSYAVPVTPTYLSMRPGNYATVTFDWRAQSSDATNYQIQISPAPFSTSTLILDSITASAKCTTKVVLDYGQSLEWRVRGRIIPGIFMIQGAWSEIASGNTSALSNSFSGHIFSYIGNQIPEPVTISIHSVSDTTVVAQTYTHYFYTLITTLNSGYICFSAPNYIRDSVYFYDPGFTPTINDSLKGDP